MSTIETTLFKVERALSELIDPEAGINVVDLGLLYEVHEEANTLHVDMIPTTAGCPLLHALTEGARELLTPEFPPPPDRNPLAPRRRLDPRPHSPIESIFCQQPFDRLGFLKKKNPWGLFVRSTDPLSPNLIEDWLDFIFHPALALRLFHPTMGNSMSNAFHNAHFEGIQYGKIRRLSGFRKGHHVPEDHSDAANAFVRKAGQEVVKLQAETLYAALRSVFSYKRKQLEYVCEDGVAAIKTPEFDVNLSIGQDENQAADYALRTEITAFRKPEIVFESAFCSLFNPYCDRMVVEFEKAVDLECKIDAIEDKDSLRPFLEYEPDCSSFTLTIPRPSIKFHVTPHQLLITLPGTRDLRQLIEHCNSAFEAFASAGVNLLDQ